MSSRVLALAILLFWGLDAHAQAPRKEVAPRDSMRELVMAPIVVSATRSEKTLQDVAVPTTVVSAETMRRQGAVRLGEVLASVPGLALFDDHGTGIQVQGFAPDYTLILIDGEPVIGRTAGTLDLDRISIQGIERVELVRGPSSSLYGSEALAGVVNLITSPPAEGVEGGIGLRAGSHGTTDMTAEAGAGGPGGSGFRVMLNRYSSAGYDLTPATYGPTTPSFADYTTDLRARTTWGRSTLRLGGRLAFQDQESAFALQDTRYDDTGSRLDWSLHPELETRLNPRLRLTTTLYGAGYRTKTRQLRQSDDAIYYSDDFDQRYQKAEAQLDAFWNTRHLTMISAGGALETLGGNRYALDGDQPETRHVFGFVQHEWLPGRRLEASASVRFDAHSDYASRLSPKLAILFRPTEAVRLRMSAGSGFKAPAFRQLYLAFSNAAAGYSVFGASRLEEGIARLEAEGQIAQLFLDPSTLDAIRAERSMALNMGGSITLSDAFELTFNGFYNDVHDLIETQPVAQKTNGQFVYGYFNISRLYTRGIESEAVFRPHAGRARVELAAGYQFLQARDRAVLDRLSTGDVFGRDPDGREYALAVRDYGGLFGRSPHSATLRAAVDYAPLGLGLSLRSRWRSRYGYRDLDGNQIANRDDEFVPAYPLFDATATKTIPLGPRTRLAIQAGVENAFDITRPTLVPSLPGRRLFAGIRADF